MNQIGDWLQRGVQAHQQGRAEEAARCYQEVLARAPKQPDALHLSGVLALQRGELKQAEKLIKRAIKANPQVADYHSNLGEVLRQQEQPAAAKRALLQAIKLKPDHALCLNNLGLVAGQLNQPDEARGYYRRALALRPDYFEAHFNLAQLLAEQGEQAEAVVHFARAAAAQPDYPPLLLSWGNALRRLARYDEALARFDDLLALQSGDPAALTNRGECLLQLQRYAEAAEALELALSSDYKLAAAHSILGVVRMEQDEPDDAIACFERALAIDPGDVQARLNLAQVEREQRQLARALGHYDQVLREQPDLPEAHFGRAMVYLAQGRWREGWADYEWRFDTPFQPALPTLDTPRWQGEPAGGRLLLLTEQGFGDNLMAWRFVPDLAERFDEVWLQVPAPLATLAEQLPGVSGVCRPDQFPDHDHHCPLLSLPHCLGVPPDPAGATPYLPLPEDECAPWRERLAALGEGLNVGLCWSGGALNPKNRKRQLGLEPLRPLLELAGVRWVSLQKECSEADRVWLADAGVSVVDWMAEMNDFRATAALVASLDLVISLDSAVAHLAGALGRECWTLVPYYHDWRWQLEGESTPWYPRMRLFRQAQYGDQWRSVVAALGDRLAARVGGVAPDPAADEPLPATAPGDALEEGVNRLCQTREGRMLVNRYDAYIGRSLMRYGEFSELELALLRPLLRSGDQVVDAGANIGVHALSFSAVVGEQGRVFAFEPQPLVFQLLCANLALNSRANVRASQAALGATPGEATVPVLPPDQPTNFGGVSLGSEGAQERVAVRTIDGLELERCRLIKVDVEGMELAVLQGAEQTLARCRPLLYVENDRPANSAALIAWLRARDYRCFVHQPPLFNPANYAGETANIFGDLVSGNLLALPASGCAELIETLAATIAPLQELVG